MGPCFAMLNSPPGSCWEGGLVEKLTRFFSTDTIPPCLMLPLCFPVLGDCWLHLFFRFDRWSGVFWKNLIVVCLTCSDQSDSRAHQQWQVAACRCRRQHACRAHRARRRALGASIAGGSAPVAPSAACVASVATASTSTSARVATRLVVVVVRRLLESSRHEQLHLLHHGSLGRVCLFLLGLRLLGLLVGGLERG